RQWGWKANGYNWFHTYLNYSSPLFATDGYEAAKGLERSYRFADILHFHNGNSLLAGYRDLSFLQSLGKKAVMHHWGSDVRIIEEANRHLPFPLPPGYDSSQRIRNRLQTTATFIEHAIIQDYELYPYVAPYYKKVHILPLAIDASSFSPRFPDPMKEEPLILHAPTNPSFKGTALIEEALSDLRSSHRFRYQRIERMSHDEALRWYNEADLIIDQVLCGSYGLFSVEGMALGKPVLAFLSEEVRRAIPHPVPIVQTDPAKIAEALLPLLQDGRLRQEMGRAGRAFVERYHDLQAVIPKLIRIYEEL
ncbi:MAG: glycosyltransferase family 4 protein, partial [Thermicanus sp.]|nr:glycosyltransferase family 4 protein [Thermicanus sp.]